MVRLLGALWALIGISGAALAADLPPSPRAPAAYVPAALPVYNWAGVYVGINAGQASIPADLGGPVICEGPFYAGAGGPAGLRVGGRDAIEIRLHVSDGAAGGGVEQDAIGGIADTPARRRQPIIAGLAIASEVADARDGANISMSISATAAWTA